MLFEKRESDSYLNDIFVNDKRDFNSMCVFGRFVIGKF